MELRLLTPADLPAAAQTIMVTFNAAPWNEAWTLGRASACLSDLLATPRAACLGAWDGDECMGAVLGHDLVNAEGLSHRISEMFVLPLAQRRGVGRALLTWHLAEAESRGVSSVHLLTVRDSAAEAFYSKLGFRRARQQIMLVRP
ncbi:GNAT family N-acetyltransferase [Deinococcus sp. SM5_A1]|uniref:GNAT family N-acetyltransferase n=1 Tax=Deinococcus sp. SM5_A1 TaxID=3379094 RepID=UPI00385D252B